MKRVWKLLALLLCIIMGVTQITGCSIGEEYKPGKWINDKEYMNSSLDIVYKLPKGWINVGDTEEGQYVIQLLNSGEMKIEFCTLNKKKDYNNLFCMYTVNLEHKGIFDSYNSKKYSKILKKYVLEDTSFPWVLQADGEGYYTKIGGIKFYTQNYKLAGIRKGMEGQINQLSNLLSKADDAQEKVYIHKKGDKLILMVYLNMDKGKKETDHFPENNVKSIKETIKKD